MEEQIINVRPRTIRGRKNKELRKSKWIPAVVYGGGRKNISFALDIRDAERYSRREYENKIFTFKSEDKDLDGLKAIRKETAYHVVKRIPLHMDFLSLDMKASIKVSVEIHFKGKPKGILEGGIFNISLRNLEIECLPENIPPFIEMDVSDLDLNENLHVSDIKIPENIKLITLPTRTLCAVSEMAEETKEAADDNNSAASPTVAAAVAVEKDKKESKKEEKKEEKKESKKESKK